jgi:hypothetical protein
MKAGKTHERALVIAQWVANTLPIQPFIVQTLAGVDGTAVSAKNFSATVNSNESQVTIHLTLIGQEKNCDAAIATLEANLKAIGFHKGTGDDVVPRADGIEYSMTWQYKSIDAMAWTR